MRVPDYNKMREAIACHEAETRETSDIYEILLFGIKGYNDIDNDTIMDIFTDYWGTYQITKKKIDIDKQQCTTCGNLVCICKD